MRIGIDARFFGGEQSKGLGRYTQKLIEYIAQEDNDNEYVIFVQQEAFDNWSIPNKNIIPILAPYKWYTMAEQLFMPLKIHQAKVDLMHFPHFNVPLFYRGRFIATIHDLIIIHYPTERATTLGPLLYKVKHLAGRIVMRHAARNSTHIITVSEYSKKDIMEYYKIPEEKITVTYEAAEVHGAGCSTAHGKEVLEKFGIEKPYFLYIGNAYPHKNLERLLEVVHTLKERGEGQPGWRLVFVGKSDYFYKRLKQETWAKNIDKHIIFTGFVPDVELPCLYQNATAFIFPSLIEGFGLPPLEAMLYGVPVLAANSSCLPEVLGDAALYFDPTEISGIIKTIKQVEEDVSLRDSLVERGKAQVARYSWSSMADKTRTVYAEQSKTDKKKKRSPNHSSE